VNTYLILCWGAKAVVVNGMACHQLQLLLQPTIAAYASPFLQEEVCDVGTLGAVAKGQWLPAAEGVYLLF
jgi:hypothetical protein